MKLHFEKNRRKVAGIVTGYADYLLSPVSALLGRVVLHDKH